MKFSGEVVLITGAARGIGEATARRFAAEGCRLGLLDLNPRVFQVAEELRQQGCGVQAFQADVTNPAQIEDVVARLTREWGSLDVLVNNAGIAKAVPLMELTVEEWERVLKVNLTGTFICSQAAARVMIPQRRGAIVNLASLAAKRGARTNGAHYAASKAGVVSLTMSLAVALAPHGIRVNAVAPGLIETEMTQALPGSEEEALKSPLGRWGSAEEVAEVICFLASSAASYITGEIVDVNGGILMD